MSLSLLDWCSRQVFKQVHSRNLVYNTCWEDPRCDRLAMGIEPHHDILMITSAGCNALDYALDGPARIYCVDLNPRQNALLELKLAAIRNLDHDTFFSLFGKGRLNDAESVYRDSLRADLTESSREFWDRKMKSYFSGETSFYFKGTTGLFARLANTYINARKAREVIEELFHLEEQAQREEIYHGSVKQLVWTGLFRRLLEFDGTLSLLGVPKPQRQQIEQSYPGGIVQFMEDCLTTVFTRISLKDNYFWWLYFFGYYTEDRCPEYLRKENFPRLRDMADRFSIHNTSILGFLDQHEGTVDRMVLLDHMDWLATYGKPVLQAEWQAIADHADAGTKILWRSAARKVDYVDPIPVQVAGNEHRVGELLNYRSSLAADLQAVDRVQTYGGFYVADWQPA